MGHGARLGHLSSYALTLMVIFYMQVRGALPCLQWDAERFPDWFEDAAKTYNVFMAPASSRQRWAKVHVDFQDFVRFFCNEFQWGQHVVSVRIGTMRRIESFPCL